ncbi:MAG: hypothetical protein ACR2OO_12460 [Thermomicrobiales bacterium]
MPTPPAHGGAGNGRAGRGVGANGQSAVNGVGARQEPEMAEAGKTTAKRR